MLISWETSRCRKGRGKGDAKGQERNAVHLRTICKQVPYSGNKSALGESPGPYALRISKGGLIFPLSQLTSTRNVLMLTRPLSYDAKIRAKRLNFGCVQ